jgi:hypothetical protein
VEKLVENKDEKKAQVTGETCRSLRLPYGVSPCMPLIARWLPKSTDLIRCGAIRETRLRDNLHRNVAIANVKVNKIRELPQVEECSFFEQRAVR